MPRLKKVPCAQCDTKIVPGVSFCTNCEQPTTWASHEERTTWELRQWSQKRASRPKRRLAHEAADVTPIRSLRAPAPSKPLVRHPSAPLVRHPSAPERAIPSPVAAPAKVRPARTTKPVPESVAASAAPAKKQVARSKPEPERTTASAAPAKKHVAPSKPEPERAPRKAARRPVVAKAPAVEPASAVGPTRPIQSAPVEPATPVQPAAVELDPVAAVTQPESIDLAAAAAKPDQAAEQTEILRELLQHVISIEEKMTGHGAGLSRRLRLLKR